jgi:5-formyltetrahydrofolate cyclo-ligase
MLDVQQQKRSLRLELKAKRELLPDVSERICANLRDWLEAREIQVVLAYKAVRSEISLESLPHLMPKTRFLTTRVNANHVLTLHDFASATVPNKYGILEPNSDEPSVDPAVVDTVLVPGLAFGRDGSRLGYGAGFYDRLLVKMRCPLVGVTRHDLLLEQVPTEHHDVRMTYLVLETGILKPDQTKMPS